MDEMPATVTATAPDQWTIGVERQAAGRSATGVVVVRQEARPDPAAPPHRALAGARAWLALGQLLLDADPGGAASCAQAGLDELGREYAPPGTKDDTGLKLLAARDLVDHGRAADGAAMMLRLLGERLTLYVTLHRATVID